MMDGTLWSWALLCGAAFLAGAVNAIAGGGTLLTFPALLVLLNPVAANATSTFALLPASLAAGWGYRREVAQSKEHLMRLWPPSLVGGIIGSLLVIRMPERVFAGMIPWLLMGASILLLVQKPVSRWIGAHPHEKPSLAALIGVVTFQLFVGIYGGYFGAGIGILMLSSLAFVGIPDINRMNAVKTLLAATMNGVTVVIFVFSGVVVWKYALVMAVTSTLGGYLGAKLARKTKPDIIRAAVVVTGFAVAFYSWFARNG